MRHITRASGGIFVALLALGGVATSAARADISDTFTTDNGGWTHVGDTGTAPSFTATGGNPGGYISILDVAAGISDYFVAPAKYLGNRSSSLGGTLSFDINLSNAADGPANDVILSNGSTSLVYAYATLPTTTGSWLHQSITLGTSDPNWHLGSPTGAAPSPADFQNVLGALQTFEILADYRSGGETNGLDNVVLQEVPEPATITALAAAVSLGVMRRRR